MRLELNVLQVNNKQCKGTTDPRVEFFNKVVTESVSQLVTDMGRLWSDLGPIKIIKYGFQSSTLLSEQWAVETSAKDDRGAAVLSPLERFPDQHGRLLQAPQGWEELLWRDHRHWGEIVALTWLNWKSFGFGLMLSLTWVLWNSPGATYQSPQDDPVRLLPLLQEPAGSEPRQASHYHLEGI